MWNVKRLGWGWISNSLAWELDQIDSCVSYLPVMKLLPFRPECTNGERYGSYDSAVNNEQSPVNTWCNECRMLNTVNSIPSINQQWIDKSRFVRHEHTRTTRMSRYNWWKWLPSLREELEPRYPRELYKSSRDPRTLPADSTSMQTLNNSNDTSTQRADGELLTS